MESDYVIGKKEFTGIERDQVMGTQGFTCGGYAGIHM
jgi:hypothetical protein